MDDADRGTGAARPGSAAGGGGRARGWARGLLERADGLFNRLFGDRLNPLYHTGAVVVALLIVLLVTGVYLLFYYRIGAPYESVARITDQTWTGRWIRTLHRYASDAAIVAIAVHALRMWVQGRSWGPRALAWVSGLVLTGVFLLCGWTGLVMIWDVPAQVLAVEGARFLDVLPIFSEPIGRTFVGERAIPGAFFFMNLFAHIAVPVGLLLILWIHVSRVARPALLPPKPLTWGLVAILTAGSILWPVGMADPAALLELPGRVPLDWFYAFWLPVTRELPAWAVWVGGGALTAALVLVPVWSRPREEERPPPSVVNERLCTGCEQCALDCPYEAITMVTRDDGRAELVARVNPDLCVSCGICAGSCAPMGVGPAGRTGRDQLARVRAFLDREEPGSRDVILAVCYRGAGGIGAMSRFHDAPVWTVDCVGSLHTSVIEFMVRSGAGGVLVVSCPPRDCWNREGAKWLEERMYHDREAELQERVDRARVELVHADVAERDRVVAALDAFRERIRSVEEAEAEEDPALDTECEVPDTGEKAEAEVVP